jgi:hypothetical protein
MEGNPLANCHQRVYASREKSVKHKTATSSSANLPSPLLD